MPRSPIENAKADAVNALIQRLIFDVAVKAAKASAVQQAPWLGFPVFSQLCDFFLNFFGEYIYSALSQGATFTIINSQTTAATIAYHEAVNEVEAAHENGDPDAISKAKENFKQTLGRLIRWDSNSAHRL